MKLYSNEIPFRLKLLIGDEYNVGWVPTKLTCGTYDVLSSHCDNMQEYYERDSNDCYVLKAGRQVVTLYYAVALKWNARLMKA